MAGLVADYSSDSETDNSSNLSSVPETPLPKPNFNVGFNDNVIKEKSVFINPFVEADKAEKAILEKHVKMISVDVKTVGGKKICWNNRKNKCRFGQNCKYAHDSDLQINKSLIAPFESNVKKVLKEEKTVLKKGKRPAVGQSVILPNKVMKLYCNQNKNEIKNS